MSPYQLITERMYLKEYRYSGLINRVGLIIRCD